MLRKCYVPKQIDGPDLDYWGTNDESKLLSVIYLLFYFKNIMMLCFNIFFKIYVHLKT